MSPKTNTGRLFIVAGEIDDLRLAALVDTVGGESARWSADAPAPWRDRALVSLVVLVGEGPVAAAVLTTLRRLPPRASTLVLVPETAPPEQVRAAADLADDFGTWPVRQAELAERLRRLSSRHGDAAGATPKDAAREPVREAGVVHRLRRQAQLREMVGEAPAFRRMVDALPRLAQQEGTVLIIGETGTGKELCARAVHQLGPSAGGPFIAVDCGSLPDQLLENELFGHARGAFTDARADQRGLVGMAHDGVLFLDEVDALSMVAQAKLLRFLQDHCYRPLGSDRFIQASVRVVAATNRDLGARVRDGRFRADLFFRLNVLRIDVPPLRERRTDIPLLAAHFLHRWDGVRAHPRAPTAAALAKLCGHAWPGNVRELENVLRRTLATIAQDAVEIDETDVDLAWTLVATQAGPPVVAQSAGVVRPGVAESFRVAKARAIAEFERCFVVQLLREHDGNITQAARAAHKDRRALGRLVKKYRAEANVAGPTVP